jgi:hypothetical protein
MNRSGARGRSWCGAVTLIQRFGSAANLNIYLHCLVLHGVYRRSADSTPEFVEATAPSDEALQAVLHRIITRLMKLLTRRALANERVQINASGQAVLKLKTAWRDGTTHCLWIAVCCRWCVEVRQVFLSVPNAPELRELQGTRDITPVLCQGLLSGRRSTRHWHRSRLLLQVGSSGEPLSQDSGCARRRLG